MISLISVTNIPQISAIYFALLQCGYDYYALEKDANLIKTIETFRLTKDIFDGTFFTGIKQDTCEVYPYWPRAAMLEAATFFVDCTKGCFEDFEAYRKKVMSATNIADKERGHDLCQWIKGFPSALVHVLSNERFQAYLRWENTWITQQNRLLERELLHTRHILSDLAQEYPSLIRDVSVILTPIKCAYSTDYHMDGNRLIVCSGIFRQESVVHEFLHPIVHPFIMEYQDAILLHHGEYSGIDPSYYLADNEQGKLNAFEEYVVRELTAPAIIGKLPINIRAYIKQML